MERVFILSVVSHETDTVECFIRHHCPIVHHIILIAQSPNTTMQGMINGLRAEGLPLSIVRETGAVCSPNEILTREMQSLARSQGADWILVLDPDAFLLLPPHRSLEDILRQLPRDRITLISKKTYIPTPEDHVFAPTILRRIVHRRNIENEASRSLLIPVLCVKEQSIFREEPMEIVDGPTGKVCDSLRSAVLSLAHFPVRSSEQLTTKVLCDVIDLSARGDGGASQWKTLFDRAARGDIFSAAELRNIALRYGLPEGTASVSQLVRDPVPTAVTALRYPQTHGHPLEALTRAAMTLAMHTAVSRSLETKKGSEGLVQGFAAYLKDSIDRVALELEPLLKETVVAQASSKEAAVVLVLGMLAAHARIPVTTEQTAQTARMALAAALPALPPRWAILQEILLRLKLPNSLEIIMREYTARLAAMHLPSYAAECRTLQGTEDWFSAILCALTEKIGITMSMHVTPAVSVLAANAAHALIQEEFGIPEGISANAVCVADPFAGRGDILRELLRRITIAAIKKGTNVSALHGDLHMRLSAHTFSDMLAAILHLHCGAVLDQYAMSFPALSTVDCSMGSLQRTRIERAVGYDPQTIAVVCTCLPFTGTTGTFRTVSPLQEAVIAQYTCQQEKFGTDAGLNESDVLQALAAVQVMLERSKQSVGIVVAPRSLLHYSALRDVRRHLTESFEQIWIVDLHGEDHVEECGDEALPGSDLSGLCMLILVRGSGIAQHIRYCDIRGLKLQKMHALFSKSINDLPWQRIGPEHPMYLFLPRA